MNPLDKDEVCECVSEKIDEWHQNRIRLLSDVILKKLTTKNPCLFRVKHLTKAADLFDDLMGALGSSSEEKEFGDFLEKLAILFPKEQ